MQINASDTDRGVLRLLARNGDILPERFEEAAWILLKKPHIVNSRLTGASIVSCRDCIASDSGETPPEESPDLEIWRRLIPKNPDMFAPVLERCLLGKKKLRIETRESENVSPPPVAGVGTVEIRIEDDRTVSISGTTELPEGFAETLVKRFARWMQPTCGSETSNQLQIDSLSLVELETYSRTYARLKEKFGKKLVEIWPEKTDPKKFVYEDIAIASYLISLWDPECLGRKVNFVDVGCGNGLLVYILMQEGHKGFGVDVRRRALWDIYPTDVKEVLLETPVLPETRYSSTEWWIGNHSDELTPWIPLLATMSSPTAKIFLLPCCPYGLYGKFQRESPELSQYQSYLTFLRDDFLPDCGFRVEVDKLRIPSTKRVCFVGRERLQEPHQAAVRRLESRLNKEKGAFVARPKEITVKNCTQISRGITDPLVSRIANAILANGSKEQTGYNRGGELPIGEVVKLVKPHELKVLKSQCGGIQTLLKNNHHIFKAIRGKVSLRIPEERSSENGTLPIRRRECWFDAHHPQGCPLSSSSCRYHHSST